MIPVLVFGNPYMEADNLAVSLAQEINVEGFDFRVLQNPDEVLNYKDYEQVIILDVFKDIKEVIVVKDIEQLKQNNIYSMHDFDLSFFLKMMKQTGNLREVIIIGIPQQGGREGIKKKIIDLMESFK